MIEQIKANFTESIQTKIAASEILPESIEKAASMMVEALIRGNKILSCGNGGSAGDAQHFSSEMLNRYERDRPSLPAIALSTDTSTITSIANDYSYEDVFSKQVYALGKHEDILLAFTTSGNSENILHAITAAKSKGISTILVCGGNGGEAIKLLDNDDIKVKFIGEVDDNEYDGKGKFFSYDGINS